MPTKLSPRIKARAACSSNLPSAFHHICSFSKLAHTAIRIPRGEMILITEKNKPMKFLFYLAFHE